MNQKEIGELRRHLQPEKSTVRRVCGCYVNGTSREIIALLDEPMSLLSQEDAEQYLGMLKKTLSGTPGKNLIDVVFTTAQVVDSEEHRLLSALRACELKDEAVRMQFFEKAAAALDMDGGNYVLLLGYDVYDVPYRGKDDLSLHDASENVFSYIVCCVCPVKDGKAGLAFCPDLNEFHCRAGNAAVCAPEIGFLFPAFDDRAANIYNALYYTRKPGELHGEFFDAVFRTEAPMSAAEQKEAFQSALTSSLASACSLEVVQNVYEQLNDRIEQHRESKDPEPLALSTQEMGSLLQRSGVEPQQAEAFCESCSRQFGESAAISPANLIDGKRFEVKTAEATISLRAEDSRLVETRVVDGRKYLLIPVGDGIEVNGIPVH